MKNKKIALAVSAGIAAYKAVELLRMLVKEGAEVRVSMSANAGQFVTPLTLEALSGNPVLRKSVNDAFSSDQIITQYVPISLISFTILFLFS